MVKAFNYFFQSLIIYFFFFIGRILGIKLSRKIFSFLFLIIGPLFRSKNTIKKNLDIFSQTISDQERGVIIKNMWKNYGMTFIEYVFLDYFRKKSSHIKIYGETSLSDLSKENKSVIFVSGHLANFELMSMEITKGNVNLATIYRPLNNFFLNPFMEFLRKRYICKNQIKKGVNGVREAIKYLNKNYSIALMIDQRVSEGDKVNFFNKQALTSTLPAQLAIKYNLSIIPVYIERKVDNKFEIEFQKEINPRDFSNKLELTKKLNKILELMIKKNPNQWIWTHNRWK
jgi:Kdo2-lipid IVA lauroyltransferase/acyltransferase